MEQTWQLRDARRTLGTPEPLTDGLLARTTFRRSNQLGESEDLTADPWVWGGFTWTQFTDPTTRAQVTDLVAEVRPGFSDALTIRPSQRPAFVHQDVGVIPGQSYTFLFYLRPLEGGDEGRFAVTDPVSGAFIVRPLPHSLAPVETDAAGYRRVGVSFTAPPGCEVVRVWLLYPGPLSRVALTPEAATYRVAHPAGMAKETRTLRVGTQEFQIGVARARRDDE